MYDVAVIGGGPGGYVAAIKAAQLGGKVAIVEKDELGGVCLNRGCIPTKAMLACAELYDTVLNRSDNFGVKVTGASLDYAAVIAHRQKVVKTLVSGVGFLMKKNSIKVFKGAGRLASANSVEVTAADGSKETFEARNIIIATGSEPAKIPIPGLDGENVWDSDGALGADNVPKSMLVIGAGAIGLEWGFMFNKFGCKVTIVELMPHILPLNDSEIADELAKSLKRSGIEILNEHKVTKVEQANGEMVATVVTADGSNERKISAEKILVAVGRRSVSTGLGLEEIGVATDRGRIIVNDRMQTNISSVYAIGDVVGGALLAHKASEEGVIASENCMGHASKMKYNVLPAAVYTSPEVASVGITEDAAKAQGIDYKVGKFSFRANGKALGIGEAEGTVKFITDTKYGEVLGCHMVGPHVTDMIHEVVIGMESEATIETIANAIHAHPTLSEVTKEAALNVNGSAIHS
ncbi:MAG: dihydrolipoyl dehydrogenase [Armatimonadota bacterium]|nr:dihydrolipoyl dehydrogenase [bacterium]